MNTAIETTTSTEVKYAGFSKRFRSQIVDMIIFSPFFVLAYCFYNVRSYYFLMAIPNVLIGIWFHVFLVQKYGGTPGKRILGIEIRKLDLSKVTYKEAWLRYAVLLGLTLVQEIAQLQSVSAMTDDQMAIPSYVEFAKVFEAMTPRYGYYVGLLVGIWVWGEAIVILFNMKKRAPHDYIAGTVVVESKSVPAVYDSQV